MEQLRRDDLITILLLLKLSQLTKFCQTSPAIAQICRDEFFWRLKVRHDIPASEIPHSLNNYQQFYFNYFVHNLPVYFVYNPGIDNNADQELFTIQVHFDDTYEMVWNKIMQQVRKLTPVTQYSIGYGNRNQ